MCEVYYSANLKQARLQVLKAYPNFEFHQVDLCEFEPVQRVWEGSNCQYIVHLAAHASVLPSFDEPFKYVYNNALSTQVVLELARRTENLKHLVYASTSSVYGRSFSKEPVKESKATHTPVSVYGASKVGNEAMAQAYADSFGTPVRGLRFFKVYGPWGRPDTVFFKFAHRIYNDRPVDVHNFGDIFHSFTYIDAFLFIWPASVYRICVSASPSPRRTETVHFVCSAALLSHLCKVTAFSRRCLLSLLWL